MKKITLTFAAIAAAFTMNAQEVIWEEDFNDQDVSDWTLYDEDGDGNNWGDIFQIGDGDGGYVTPVSLISRSWQGTPLSPDNWAVSPIIDLTGVDSEETLTLSWLRQVSPNFPGETYSVYVGMSNDIDVLINSDITLTESFSDEPSEETNDPTTVTLDISDFAGSIAYIAIRHYNSYDADYLSIDDLTITSETEMSVSNFENAQLSHFNTNETLNVNSSLDLETLEIYSILGKKVGSEILNGNSASINIAHLQKGVYLAKVSAEGQTKTFKFIKK